MNQDPKETINATIRLTPHQWVALERIAKELGIRSRQAMIRLLADGHLTISLNPTYRSDAELLGESLAS
ncbi:MAG: hypothetical protein HC925_00060 [Coleofasciculaceae cyanobacterium SM2_3_26]|nr:hypothetical protein [Coleofasciculaceae cyanobacterium SM2_3_26]